MKSTFFFLSAAAWLIYAGPTILPTAEDEAPFPIRGTLPWHNFLSGPTAWNFTDYQKYLDELAENGLNFVGFHCYTGGEQRYVNYVEPLLRVSYRNILPAAEFDTSITSRWGYLPLTTDQFAFGTGKLFRQRVFGADCAIEPTTNEQRYEQAQALMRRVMAYAHEKGIKVGLGFEFGVYPPEFYSALPSGAMLWSPYLPDPTHAANIEILRLYIRNLKEAYPGLDYAWFWLQELSNPTGRLALSPAFQEFFDRNRESFAYLQNELREFDGVWSLAYVLKAYEILREEMPQARMVISGWGGGDQLPPLLKGLHQTLPQEIIFSCLNPDQGWTPQPPIMGEMTEREVWIIPWLEGDRRLWHPQPRVSLLAEQIALAQEQQVDGVIGIHWRTKDIEANLDALGSFTAKPELVQDSHRKPAALEAIVSTFYRDWCREQYGANAADIILPRLRYADLEQYLAKDGLLESPEYVPYEPWWGRLSDEQRREISELLQELTDSAERNAGEGLTAAQEENRSYLCHTLRGMLHLDRTGVLLEPAYRFKQASLEGRLPAGEEEEARAQAIEALREAKPQLQALLEAYAARVQSQGDLGVLSAMNQKIWSLYRELEDYLQPEPENG